MESGFLIKKFDFLLLCSRFVSGGESLKSQRSISRKRFLLAMSGISNLDKDAIELWYQAKGFFNAVNFLHKKNFISLECLCEVNKMVLLNHRHAGKVRNFQNWVGTSLENATYIPPAFEDLDDLLSNFLIDLNKNLFECNFKSKIKIYSDFLKIHPFADGNGRCARVIWLALLNSPNKIIPPFIYRLICSNPASHDIAISNSFEQIDEFWNDMESWSHNKSECVYNYIYLKMHEVVEIIPDVFVNGNLQEIVSLFSNYPYVDINFQDGFFDFCSSDFLNDLRFLEGIGFISKRALRSEGKIFYECKFFYDVHLNIDRIIMS